MDRLTTKKVAPVNLSIEEKQKKVRYHGFATALDADKFDLRKCGSDAADEHAVRYFTGRMMDKMIDAKAAGNLPWYVGISEEHIRFLFDKACGEGDMISVANYAMMLHIRKELKK